MINIKEVVWTNFLGYGDYKNSLIFDDIKGICLIEGEIEGNDLREEGDEKLNAAGKTSAIEAIVWGLFGNTTRLENPGDKVINWDTGKNCRVSIKTTDGYEIIRMRKYSGSSKGSGLTELLIMKDGEDITQSTSLPAQQFINKTFGINYHIFIRSVVFGQFSGGFLELSDQKIRKVIENILGIDDFSPIVKTAKNKLTGIDKELSAIDANIDNCDKSISKSENQLELLKEKSTNFKIEIKDEIEEIKNELNEEKSRHSSKVAELNDSINKKKENKKSFKLIDTNKLKIEWEKYENDILVYEQNVDKLNSLKSKITKLENNLELNNSKIALIEIKDKLDIDKIKKQHNTISKIEEEINKRNDVKQKLNNIILDLNAKIKIDNEFINNDHDFSECPTCRSSVDKSHLETKINESNNNIKNNKSKIAEINDKIEKLDKSLDNFKNKINSIDTISIDDAIKFNDQIDQKESEKNSLLEENNKIQKLIKKLNSDIDNIDASEPKKPETSIKEAESNNELINNIDKSIFDLEQRITESNNEFKQYISTSKSKINSIKNKNNPYDELITSELDSLNNNKESKQQLIKSKNEKKTLRLHIDYIRESYNNKRKIKAFWISELIPSFNRCLRYYLDFFEIEDKLEFDEFLSPKLNKWGYDTHSGGECKRIDISLMLALSDLHSINYDLQSNFMVFDEVDGRVDPFTINKLVSLLSDDIINRKGIDNIFVISHRKEMKDRFPHKIKVKNKQGRSYIVNHE